VIYGNNNLTNINLANLATTQGISITGGRYLITSYEYSYSVSTTGDVNGDGISDMIIGAWGYNTRTGIVYVIYGSKNLTNITLLNLPKLKLITVSLYL
jgi:hypothetical protein